jgi:hypothetical protein
MRNEKDKSTIYLLNLDPIVVDTHLKFIKLKWNHNGSILAVSGTQKVTFNSGEEKDICALFLYDSFGNVIIYFFYFSTDSQDIENSRKHYRIFILGTYGCQN